MKPATAKGLVLVGTVVVVAIVGAACASAAGAAVHYWRCLPVPAGTGNYKDIDCFRPGALSNFERDYIAATPISVKASSAGEFKIEVSSLSLLIVCKTVTGTGSVANPEPYESTNGKGEVTLTFKGCTLPGLKACSIPGEGFTTAKLSAVAEESKTLGTGVKFAPASGSTIAIIELTGAECVLPEEMELSGNDFGIANEEGQLEFTNESSGLSLGGEKALLRGLLELKDEKGNTVSVE